MIPGGRRPVPDAHRQLASLPLAVVLLAPGLTIASVNPAAEQFFGQSSARLAGRSLTDVMSFSNARLIDRLSDSDAPVSAREIDVMIEDRGSRRIDIAAAPVADAPGWQLLTLHDNSAIEAMGEGFAGMDASILRGPEILAHEIKNPLAAIRGAAQLLGRRLGEKDQSLTGLIAAEVDRIAALIGQMQLLSGTTVPPAEACNLHEIIRRAIAVLDAADVNGQGRVSLIEEFDPSLPPVLGHPDSLVQIVINLLVNAQEACRSSDHARLTVRTRFASGLQLHAIGSGESVRLPIELRVSDNGPGVEPAIREHIFEPFVTSKISGRGLGLPLVRKLVRDMNGRVSHERDESAGITHFRVHLQLAQDVARVQQKGKKVP